MGKRDPHIAESEVMGKLPTRVLSYCLALAAIGQLFEVPSTKLLEALGGGPLLDAVWAAALLLAALLLTGAWLFADKSDQVVLEVGGIILMLAGLVAYFVAVATASGGLGGRLVILALCSASIFNVGGRGVLLARQLWWVWKALS